MSLFAVGSFALLPLIGSAAPAGGSPREVFTLEQVMSAPFPSDLTAARVGGAVAWVFDARGARNVWIAEPPDYRGRAMTSYTGDDGQEITELAFMPDGRGLVYVRGGPRNHDGENPNPKSDPAGSTQAVYAVSGGGGDPQQVGEGASPAVSPRGDRLAFVQKDKVWWAPLDGSAKGSPMFQARGNCGHLRWSPDGSLLAFVSRRGDHSFVGLFDPNAKTIRYLDPSVDRDGDPVWSPDGKRLAFVRIPPSPASREMLRPHREGPPWSLRVAEVASGQAREVFRAGAGRGSVFRAIVGPDQLIWADGDRIIFPWETDGWTHLYSVSASGGPPLLLTPGEFEVEHVSVLPDRQAILYSSNQGDLERRHIWRVAVVGGKPVALTSGAGVEWSPVASGDGKAVAFVSAGSRRHPSPVIRVGSAPDRDLAPGAVPADFPEASLVIPEAVVFSATDGLSIHGQLFRPADSKPGQRRPAVIFFHGGSRRQMLPGWHYMYYYRNAYAMNQYLASRGFIVLSVNYRSGIGYGMEFREAVDFGATGASEYRDVAGAGLYLRGRADVDGTRIGLWGGSYGGYLTALGLARASDLFAAGVDFHGVHDWSEWFRLIEREDLGGRNAEQLIFPDEIHDFLVQGHWIEAYRAATEFLERYLKK